LNRHAASWIANAVAGIGLSIMSKNVLRWRASYHETTHAVACYLTKNKVYAVEIDDEGGGCIRDIEPYPVPRTAEQDSKGWAALCESFEKFPPTTDFVRDNLLILLAPCHAVFRLTADASLPGCGDDLRRARTLVEALPMLQQQRGELLHEVHETLRYLVDRLWEEITVIAARLYEAGRLFDGEIRELLKCTVAGRTLLLGLEAE
jgi:hypothetical protein